MPMMQQTNELVGRLVDAYESGQALLVVTDYDGALTPIARTPEQARLGNRARRLLRALADLPDVFVGITSGRSVDDLKQMVGLSGIYYAGTGGLELDFLGVRVNHPLATSTRAHLDSLVPRLSQLIASYEGAWLEHKPFGLTLHYRELSPRKAELLTLGALRMLEIAADRLRVRRVARGLEVTPDLDWNKGTALEFILEDAARDALPFYAGDPSYDLYDLDAIRAARRHGGIAVGVGIDNPREAQGHLESPMELIEMLESLCKSIEKLHATCLSRARVGW